ncbi:hypothetical protein D5F01_LYC21274 [Larimichthys crocea]|uniref:Uncharacterized protein n=1 Tax=Larimichthys crocea TaxID=215358 RepID=A0A6G0HNW2_LARCR|nr:hypothetical protein D5F01_LYC21274 [Larimichthys crocea]
MPKSTKTMSEHNKNVNSPCATPLASSPKFELDEATFLDALYQCKDKLAILLMPASAEAQDSASSFEIDKTMVSDVLNRSKENVGELLTSVSQWRDEAQDSASPESYVTERVSRNLHRFFTLRKAFAEIKPSAQDQDPSPTPSASSSTSETAEALVSDTLDRAKQKLMMSELSEVSLASDEEDLVEKEMPEDGPSSISSLTQEQLNLMIVRQQITGIFVEGLRQMTEITAINNNNDGITDHVQKKKMPWWRNIFNKNKVLPVTTWKKDEMNQPLPATETQLKTRGKKRRKEEKRTKRTKKTTKKTKMPKSTKEMSEHNKNVNSPCATPLASSPKFELDEATFLDALYQCKDKLAILLMPASAEAQDSASSFEIDKTMVSDVLNRSKENVGELLTSVSQWRDEAQDSASPESYVTERVSRNLHRFFTLRKAFAEIKPSAQDQDPSPTPSASSSTSETAEALVSDTLDRAKQKLMMSELSEVSLASDEEDLVEKEMPEDGPSSISSLTQEQLNLMIVRQQITGIFVEGLRQMTEITAINNNNDGITDHVQKKKMPWWRNIFNKNKVLPVTTWKKDEMNQPLPATETQLKTRGKKRRKEEKRTKRTKKRTKKTKMPKSTKTMSEHNKNVNSPCATPLASSPKFELDEATFLDALYQCKDKLAILLMPASAEAQDSASSSEIDKTMVLDVLNRSKENVGELLTSVSQWRDEAQDSASPESYVTERVSRNLHRFFTLRKAFAEIKPSAQDQDPSPTPSASSSTSETAEALVSDTLDRAKQKLMMSELSEVSLASDEEDLVEKEMPEDGPSSISSLTQE